MLGSARGRVQAPTKGDEVPTLTPGQKAARTRRRRAAGRKAAATRKGIGVPKIPRGSYRTLKGALGWRLYNPLGTAMSRQY